MDDRHVEDLLLKSWTPRTPDGMRDRTLRRARQELARKQPAPLFILRNWKLALACIGILIVVLLGISDNARSQRLAAVIGGGSGTPASTPCRAKSSDCSLAGLMAQWRVGATEGGKSL